MITIKNMLWVMAGGSIGAALRYGISMLWKTESFPYSTLAINIAGSFLIGIIFALSTRNVVPGHLQLFLATGFCGGFTTFSAFSLENMQLLKSGNYSLALTYILLSVVICMLAVFAGFKLLNQ